MFFNGDGADLPDGILQAGSCDYSGDGIPDGAGRGRKS